MTRILMKTYTEKRHALAFIQGTMFANSLSHFRQLEERDVRRDTEEGIITMPLTEGIKLELTSNAIDGPIVLNRDDLVEPPTLRPNWFNAVNLFCMHMIDFHREGNAGILKIPFRATSFGRYAVVILDVGEFISRVKRAVDRTGYRLSYGQVQYYDSAIGIHTSPTTLEPIFTKRNDYQGEQEFRIAVDRRLAVPTPLELEVGPLSDIAELIVLGDPVSDR